MLKESGQQCSSNWQVERAQRDVQGKSDRHPNTRNFTFDSNIGCPVKDCPMRFLAEIRKNHKSEVERKLWSATGTCIQSGEKIETGWRHW